MRSQMQKASAETAGAFNSSALRLASRPTEPIEPSVQIVWTKGFVFSAPHSTRRTRCCESRSDIRCPGTARAQRHAEEPGNGVNGERMCDKSATADGIIALC
jgi:hypothetical protein